MMHEEPPRPSSTGQGLRVAMFAGLAEAAGARVIELPWTGGTAGDLLAAVAARVPAAAAVAARSAVVVDGRHAAAGDAVPPGADVAVLPPVSGG